MRCEACNRADPVCGFPLSIQVAGHLFPTARMLAELDVQDSQTAARTSRGRNGAIVVGNHSGRRRKLDQWDRTVYGDVPMTAEAMKAGAVEFLTKPINDDALLSAIRSVTDRSTALIGRDAEFRSLELRYDSLTSREREVFALVVSGLPNKQVGGELGISEITV